MMDLWIQAAHVVAVMAWMAGLLYLPRLYVYHSQSTIGSEQSETFKVMERRLLRAIMNPAMIATWVLGLYLAWSSYAFKGGWLHAKIALVVAMSVVHMMLARHRRAFESDSNVHSTRYYRVLNEVPTVLMIAIVALVIVKPF